MILNDYLNFNTQEIAAPCPELFKIAKYFSSKCSHYLSVIFEKYIKIELYIINSILENFIIFVLAYLV